MIYVCENPASKNKLYALSVCKAVGTKGIRRESLHCNLTRSLRCVCMLIMLNLWGLKKAPSTNTTKIAFVVSVHAFF